MQQMLHQQMHQIVLQHDLKCAFIQETQWSQLSTITPVSLCLQVVFYFVHTGYVYVPYADS